jgi:hypothetical protein
LCYLHHNNLYEFEEVKLKYLDDRHGVWRYRRVYPPELQSKIGKKEYVVSLRTRDRILAMERYPKHDKMFETMIALARNGTGNTGDVLKVRQVARNIGLTQFPDEIDNLPASDVIQISAQNLEIHSKLPESEIALAALGQTVTATLMIEDVLEEYKRLERDKLRKMSNRELKKFLAPIELAIKEFKAFAGDINILRLKKGRFSTSRTSCLPMLCREK